MRMSQAAFLMVLAALVLPALAHADCYSACEAERQQCYGSQCPGMESCEGCDAAYNNCLSYCAGQGGGCIPPGGIDDVLSVTDCCSGNAVPGSTYCANSCDWGTTWASCTQVCA